MRKLAERFFGILKRFFLYFFIISFLLVLLYRFINPPVTPLMALRFVENSFNNEKTTRFKREYVAYTKISPHLVGAVVASEDQKFPYHFGFDFHSMEKAYLSNKKGKKIKGGSTISQQVAKNVFLWPGRSYVRKGLEAYFTILIELLWGKERIMEVYLNVIEMGDGIYGAEAASRYYFNKTAVDLSRAEAALLASILPSPRRYNVKNPSLYIQGRQVVILKEMLISGKVKL